MANRAAPNSNRASAKLRCAIYTRKSSEEGLEQDFNSLDAQREACEAFIASQKREGRKASSIIAAHGGCRSPAEFEPSRRRGVDTWTRFRLGARSKTRQRSIGFIGFPKGDFGRVIPYTRP